jgi:tetratricopeptide (TPR) repeat protein
MKKLLFLCFCVALAFQFTSCNSDEKKKEKATDQNLVIGQAKLDAKDYKGAIIAFYKCIKINPKNYDAIWQLGKAQIASGAVQKGLKSLKYSLFIMEHNLDLTDEDNKKLYTDRLNEYTDQTKTAVPDNSAPHDSSGHTF